MADRPGEGNVAALKRYLTHWIRLMPTMERDAMQEEAFAALGRLVAERDAEYERFVETSQAVMDRADAAEAERDELRTRLQAQEQDFGDDRCAFVVVREWCREELASGERCNQPAEVILWGKLLPPSALGPRCYDHAAHHIGHRSVHDPQWATFDLRGLHRGTTLSEPPDSEGATREGGPGAIREDAQDGGSLSGGTSAGSARPPDPDLAEVAGDEIDAWKHAARMAQARAEAAERERDELREALRPAPTDEGGPGKEEAYWLRAKLRGAITHLRDVEDYYRVQGGLPLGFNMIRADRARDLYEAITEDFVNGSRDRPTRADLERRVAQLEEALRAAVPYIKWVILTCDSPSDVADAETALKAARAVLAGGTPPPGTADSGDSRAVVAEDAGLSGGSEDVQFCPDCYSAHGPNDPCRELSL